MTVSQAVTIARNLIQPTDGVPLCDSGMVNLIYARSLDAQRKKVVMWSAKGTETGA
jgi:hypothetical protein